MGKKYTYIEVKKVIESIGCKLLSDEYINNKNKLKVQCKCGRVFYRSFQDIKNKKMYYCTCCTGGKFNYEYAKDFIESVGCELISTNYVNSDTKLDIKCKCGNIYQVSFNVFRRFKQYQCQECGQKLRIERMKNRSVKDGFGYYTHAKINKIIQDKTSAQLLSKEYINCFDKLKLKCECGNIFHQNFSHINNKLKQNLPILCPECMKNISDDSFRFNEEDINKKIFDLHGYQKYSICDINEYVNSKKKVEFIHNECGHIFKSSLHNILYSGRLCPNCESEHSNGVYKIIEYLDNNNIRFEMEKTFSDCRNIKPLPFDFYLNDYNALIEFDGQQHFYAVDFFGGQEYLNKIKFTDNIKNKYCEDNNIELIRISYKQVKQIDDILNKFIDKLIPR